MLYDVFLRDFDAHFPTVLLFLLCLFRLEIKLLVTFGNLLYLLITSIFQVLVFPKPFDDASKLVHFLSTCQPLHTWNFPHNVFLLLI